jgi:hypothetical protein
MINCVNDKWPVHGFIAIEEVALENEPQDISVVTSSMDINLWRKQF